MGGAEKTRMYLVRCAYKGCMTLFPYRDIKAKKICVHCYNKLRKKHGTSQNIRNKINI